MAEQEDGMDSSVESNLFDGYRSLLLTAASTKIPLRFRSRIDPSDVVQNVLARATLAIAKGSKPIKIQPWLWDMLGKQILDDIKHSLRQKRDITRECSAGDRFEIENDLCQQLPGDHTSPSQAAIRKERLEIVFRIIGQLPEQQRMAITLKFVEGLTLDEIVGKMQSTERAVAGLLRRGMQGISRRLKMSSNTEGDSAK